MQLSEASIFAFTEGSRVDSYIYGRLCSDVLKGGHIQYRVVTAVELQGDGGGKNVLLHYFEWLSGDNLLSQFKGKATAALFFLDKDIDDLLRRRIADPHIVYTRTYDIEGEIFAAGDIARAGAATACLDELEVRVAIGDDTTWRRNCAHNWRDWITICIFCKKHELPNTPNYRSSSQINDGPAGGVNAEKLNLYNETLKTKSGMKDDRFSCSYRAAERLVSRIFALNRHDQVFKGKWYVELLKADIIRVAAGRSINLQGLRSGILGALSMNLDYGAEWSEHYKTAIRAIQAQVHEFGNSGTGTSFGESSRNSS